MRHWRPCFSSLFWILLSFSQNIFFCLQAPRGLQKKWSGSERRHCYCDSQQGGWRVSLCKQVLTNLQWFASKPSIGLMLRGTVCLPTGHQHILNKTAVVAGWGRINQGVSGDTVLKLRWALVDEAHQQVFFGSYWRTEFRYAQLKEIELDECREKYDHFLRRSRKKAFLTTNQLCAGDDKVRNLYSDYKSRGPPPGPRLLVGSPSGLSTSSFVPSALSSTPSAYWLTEKVLHWMLSHLAKLFLQFAFS